MLRHIDHFEQLVIIVENFQLNIDGTGRIGSKIFDGEFHINWYIHNGVNDVQLCGSVEQWDRMVRGEHAVTCFI